MEVISKDKPKGKEYSLIKAKRKQKRILEEKAYFDYFIEDKIEAGIELVGSEVKSIKASKVSIKESFVRIIKEEAI